MGATVCDFVWQGFLSRVHDALVSRRALIPIAQHLGVPRFMVANGRTMLNGPSEHQHTTSGLPVMVRM